MNTILQIKGIVAVQMSRIQREPTIYDNTSMEYVKRRKEELERALRDIHELFRFAREEQGKG